MISGQNFFAGLQNNRSGFFQSAHCIKTIPCSCREISLRKNAPLRLAFADLFRMTDIDVMSVFTHEPLRLNNRLNPFIYYTA